MVKTSLTRKKLLWTCIIILALAAAAVGVWYYYNKKGTLPGQSDGDALVHLCSGDAAKKMQTALTSGDYDTLTAQAAKIRKIKTYTTDISCVYIVAEADAAQGDGEAAQRNYQQLTKLRADGQNLDTEFVQQDVQIDALKQSIDFMAEDSIQTDRESGALPVDGAEEAQ